MCLPNWLPVVGPRAVHSDDKVLATYTLHHRFLIQQLAFGPAIGRLIAFFHQPQILEAFSYIHSLFHGHAPPRLDYLFREPSCHS